MAAMGNGLAMLRRLLTSGSFRGAATFALGGAGFALGNIILAGVLPPAQFGVLSLVMALMQFGLSCGPLGMDVVVKRHRPRVTRALLGRVLGTALVAGGVIALAASATYTLAPVAIAATFLGAVLAAGNNTVAAVYQSRGLMGWALALSQGPNFVFLVLAVLALAFGIDSAGPVLAGVVAGYLLTNLVGWWRARRDQSQLAPLNGRLALREALASVSIGLSLQLLWQLERVAIPKLTSLDDLATYAVLAAIIGAPFRATQIGIAFTLIEKLRSARDAAAARAVLRHELLVAAVIVAGAVGTVLLVSPLVLHWYLRDKYVIGPALMTVTIAVGLVRVCEGFTTTVITAFGDTAALARISALGWLGLLVGIGAAVVGSRFGLVGIVGGTFCGWLTLVTGGMLIALKSYRARFAALLAAEGANQPLSGPA